MMLSLILLSVLTILFSTLNMIRHLICDNNQSWLLNLNLIYETLDWGRKWLDDFSAGKTQLVLFDQSNNTGAIDVKVDGSVCEENSYFKMLLLTFSSKLHWVSCILSIAKTGSKKIGALIRSMKYLYSMLLVATWHCWTSYKNGYAGLLVLHLPPLLNPGLIVKMQ